METYLDEIDDEIMVLVADGGLDARNARQLGEKLEALVDAGIRELIVDCSKLTFVSSAGLGVLLKANRQLGALGGQVHLAGVGGPIVQILRIARLDGILKLHEDVGRAKHALRKHS
ncbi:MAG: STAS domain-containing protein [Planctomycetota bacterium]|nr:STAS domain-containing protein [Planctomycetota bacterium]